MAGRKQKVVLMPVPINKAGMGQGGEGWFTDAVGTVVSGAKKVGRVIKDAKLVSRGLSALPDGRAKTAGAVAGALGWGEEKKASKTKGAGKKTATRSRAKKAAGGAIRPGKNDGYLIPHYENGSTALMAGGGHGHHSKEKVYVL